MRKKTIFVLHAHELDSQEHNYLLPKVKKDLTVDLTNHELGTFSSREKAEKMIASWLEHVKSWNLLLLGFTITEKLLDGNLGGKFKEISEFESRWSYDGKGNFLCDSLYDDGCAIPFKGRKVQVPTKIGDIVLERFGNCAAISLVTQLPPTEDWWITHIKGGFSGDCTDDSYTTVRWQQGHDHPNSTRVFPFVGIPTKEVERKLWSEFKGYVKDCGLPKKCIPIDRHHLKEDWEKES